MDSVAESWHGFEKGRLKRFGFPVRVALFLVAVAIAVATVALADQSGREDYVKNCAGCHGDDGRGNGPSLYVLGVHPPDLTLLSKQNGGVFPFQQVEDSIDGRKGIPSHERFDMPFWGVTLQESGKEFTPESDAKVKARIDSIVRYLETIQRK